jgi:antagonist of KipI
VIEVLSGGTWTTIQDRGRPGWERLGVSPGGPADWFSAAAANALVGNDPDAALLECTLIGPTLRFRRGAMVALMGGETATSENGIAFPVAAGAALKIGRVQRGLRTYLAVRGGIAVPRVMGSRAFSQLGGFGGGFGRPLQAGDELPIGKATPERPPPLPLPEGRGLPLVPEGEGNVHREWSTGHRLPLVGPWEVRAMAGPHGDAFGTDDFARFLNTAFRVTPRADRMGMRLQASGLRLHPLEILTTPVTQGAVQLTPSGEAIVLLAEHQTTGGYPVIATVISADWPLLGQARPGDTIHFREASLAEAQRARGRLDGWLRK